ncbi:MAG: putative oxidoreductase [Cyclobacteriaceae bacterium]|jgi:putative oxidoreductase
MKKTTETWIRLILGLYLIGYALNQFLHLIPTSYGNMPEITRDFIDSIIMYLPFLYLFEIVIGLLLIFNKWTGVILIVLVPLSVSFMMFNIINGDFTMLWPALFVAALNVALLYFQRDRYRPLLG